MGLFAILWSLGYFTIIVVWLIFLSKEDYKPDPIRLLIDILISGLFTISAFATIYRSGNLIDTLDKKAIIGVFDYLYFSMVTFSTLGFGDFRPSVQLRLWAGLQAILGNLHLGLLAGATFYAVQFRTERLNHLNSEKDDRSD